METNFDVFTFAPPDGFQKPQDGSKVAQAGPTEAQEAPKMSSKRPQSALREPPDKPPGGPHTALSGHPKRAQKNQEHGPKGGQGGHRTF